MRVGPRLLGQVRRAARHFAALIVTGPRRAGKTTLLRRLFPWRDYYPRTLVPVAEEAILRSVEKKGRFVIAHEAVKRGFGSEIAALVSGRAMDSLDAPVVRLGARNVPMPYNDNFPRETTPTQQRIVEPIRGVLVSS